MKKDKYFVLFDGASETGPYTHEQMACLWQAGSLHEGLLLRKSSSQELEYAVVYRHYFESRNPAPITILVILSAILGACLSVIMGAWGLLVLISSSSAVQESVGAIMLAGGLTACCICILGIGVITKR